MLDINNPNYAGFKRDIQSHQTSTHVIVVIGWNSELNEPSTGAIYISQTPEMIDNEEVGYTTISNYYIDADLKISSIRESIDFESRKFKISTLTITLSNLEDLSDVFGESDLINKSVAVFYKTPSCKELINCFPIYIANVRRYDHTNKNIKITLEDKTQEKISKDIPLANVGTNPETSYSSKYDNRYIPITYGRLDYAPAIPIPDQISATDIIEEETNGNFKLICDDVLNEERDIVTGYPSNNGVYAKKGQYWQIYDTKWSNLDGGSYTNTQQHTISEDRTYYLFEYLYSAGLPLNIIGANEFQGIYHWYPNSVGLVENDGYDNDGVAQNGEYWIGPIDTVNENPEIVHISAPGNVFDDINDYNTFGILGEDTRATVPNNDVQTMAELSDPPECDFTNGYDFSGSVYESSNPFKFVPKIILDASLPRMKWDLGADFNNTSTYTDLSFNLDIAKYIYGGEIHDLEWIGDYGNEKYSTDQYQSGQSTYSITKFKQYPYKLPRAHHLKYLHLAEDIQTTFTAPDNNGVEHPIQVDNAVAFIQLPSARQMMARIKSKMNAGQIYVHPNLSTDSNGDVNLNWIGSSASGHPASACFYADKTMDAKPSSTSGYDGYGETISSLYSSYGYGYHDETTGDSGVWGWGGPVIGGQSFPAGYQGQQVSSGEYQYNDLLYPLLHSATPEGCISWFFGFFDDGINPPENYTPMTDYPFINQTSVNVCFKYIQVSFNKDGTSYTWSSKDDTFASLGDKYIMGHYNLHELFDLSKMPIVIPYQRTGSGMNWADDDNQGKSIKPRYNCYWNGVHTGTSGDLSGGVNEAQQGTEDIRFGGRSSASPYTHDKDTDVYKNLMANLSSGEDRWFTVNLAPWKGLPAGYMQSTFCLGYEDENNYTGDRRLWAGFSGGTVQGNQSQEFMYLRSRLQGDGRRLGIRCMLPELEAEDAIDGAMKVIFRRRIKMTFDGQNTTSSAENRLRVMASANNAGRYGTEEGLDTYEKSSSYNSNTPSQWSATELSDGWDDSNPEEPFIILDNTGTQSYNTYVDNDDANSCVMWGGTPEDGYYPWEYIDQYNNFIMHFANSWSGNGSVENIVFNLQIYKTYMEVRQDFENLNDSDFYVNTTGRLSGDAPIESPTGIINDLLFNELSFDDSINPSDQAVANQAHLGWAYAFSVKDKIDSKDLIEKFCTNTKLFPRFKSQKEFGFITIPKNQSHESSDMVIDPQKVIKYSYTRTKADSIKSKVLVKFAYDYGNDNYSKNTGWVSAKDFLGDGDLGFYNPGYLFGSPEQDELGYGLDGYGYSLNYFNTTEEDASLSFEAKFIQDRYTAEKLSEFLVMWHCNQHTIMKCTTSLFYIALEVGDIISFSSLMGGRKAYGEDYTQAVRRNGQIIYPRFLITSVQKTAKDMSIEAIQLHLLEHEITFLKGQISRQLLPFPIHDSISEEDKLLLEDYVHGNTPKEDFTRYQVKNMDINDSNSINERDIEFWEEWKDSLPRGGE